jgi:hypothetical protein
MIRCENPLVSHEFSCFSAVSSMSSLCSSATFARIANRTRHIASRPGRYAGLRQLPAVAPSEQSPSLQPSRHKASQRLSTQFSVFPRTQCFSFHFLSFLAACLVLAVPPDLSSPATSSLLHPSTTAPRPRCAPKRSLCHELERTGTPGSTRRTVLTHRDLSDSTFFIHFNGWLYDSFRFRQRVDAGPMYDVRARRSAKAGLALTLDKENSCVI